VNQAEKTKDNILKAAQREFIAKGYNKARMEDIAAGAGVTKMMLYYYFSSKENILQALSENILEQARLTMQQELAAMINIKKPDPEFIKSRIKTIIESNGELMAFMVREFVNGSLNYNMVFTLLKNLYDLMLDSFRQAGARIKSREQYYLRMFFFQSVPLLIYFLFKERFAEAFSMDPEIADKVFYAKFAENIAHTLGGPPVP
jgi:AcrR family transcriptional regulator